MKPKQENAEQFGDQAAPKIRTPGGDTTWQRLLWFVLLWGLGVLTITVVGYGLKWLFFSG